MLTEHKGNPGMVRYCVAYAHGQRQGDIGIEHIKEALEQEDTFIWVALAIKASNPSDVTISAPPGAILLMLGTAWDL